MPTGRALRLGSARTERLASDFGIRGASICSASTQQQSALPKPATAQELVTVARETVAILADKNRQLFALASPYRGLPAVRQFLRDMRAEAEEAGAIFRDLMDRNQQATAQAVRESTVNAPRYWQDAGKLGMPTAVRSG